MMSDANAKDVHAVKEKKEKKTESADAAKDRAGPPKKLIMTALQSIDVQAKDRDSALKKLQKELDGANKEVDQLTKRRKALEEQNEKKDKKIEVLMQTIEELKQRLVIYGDAHKKASARRSSKGSSPSDHE